MLQNYGKRLIAGTLSLLLMLSIGALCTPKAYGQAGITTTNPDTVHSQWQARQSQKLQVRQEEHEGRTCFVRRSIMGYAAATLGIDQKSLIQLHRNKTLVEIAADQGIGEKEFIVKLHAHYSKEIEQAVTNGKLDRAQADLIKAGLGKKLAFIVNHKADGKIHHKHHHMMVGLEKMAGILGMSVDKLKSELEAGKSLEEIAQSKNISKEELVSKIKDELTPWIMRLVERKQGENKVK